eukprot:3650049-Rhodomonas_salina.2
MSTTSLRRSLPCATCALLPCLDTRCSFVLRQGPLPYSEACWRGRCCVVCMCRGDVSAMRRRVESAVTSVEGSRRWRTAGTATSPRMYHTPPVFGCAAVEGGGVRRGVRG